MNETPRLPRALRFGAFEVDFQARELRKRGLRLKLQEKPFQILELLLERAGEVVTRKELHQRLWPDSFVGFDRSLNTAVNKLRQVLADPAGSPRFVETLARRGYRFIAPVGGLATASPGELRPAAIDSLAVLPFQNVSGDPEMEYLSDGITESIIHNLSQLPKVRVLARSTVFRYKGREIDPQTAGRELHLRAVLVGRVVQRGEALTISAELVEVENGWHLWGAQYDRKPSDILAVENEISKEISAALRLHLSGEEKKRLAKHYTENAEAYRDYLQGRYHGNKLTADGLNKAIGHFQQAIKRDPSYALAYAGLADTYGLFAFFGLLSPREVMPRAKEAATKALEIDAGLAEAHASLASIKKVYDWDWPAAEAEYQRALELNPNYAAAHHWYADFLSAMGRSAEAMREIYTAQELDPLSLVISNEVAWNSCMARDYERAVEEALKTLEMDSSFAAAHYTLGLACSHLGQSEKAVVAFQRALEGSGGNPASLAGLAHAFALAGRKAEATMLLDELRATAERGYVPPYWSAIVCAGLGEKAAALDWLEEACEVRDVWLVWLKGDPRLDPLRSEPRFEYLMSRVGLGL